jgi:hypothetical protein
MTLLPKDTGLIRSLYAPREFEDRISQYQEKDWVDVIIPVIHSNDLWRENLISFYREIPIKTLFVGDAGCIDDTILILQEFPRVQIVDHKHLKTLGSSLANLIQRVSTERFVYVQSDVYLPPFWFETMMLETEKYSWVGSPMQVVTMLDYELDYSGRRPLAGAQMGHTKIFEGLPTFIADDYVYRQEDFVLQHYVKLKGGNPGSTKNTFHYHQVMRRKTIGMEMNVSSISIQVSESISEKNRVQDSQLSGLIKYCSPSDTEVRQAAYAAFVSSRSFVLKRFRVQFLLASENNQLWKKILFKFFLKAMLTKISDQINYLFHKLIDKSLRLP